MAAKLNTRSGGRYALGQISDINITPFVDVMLVLMIIFMVALPAATTTIQLNLPPARAPKDPTPAPTVINILPDGIYVGDVPTTLDALPSDLGRALGRATPGSTPGSAPIYVRADRKVRYARFMAVMDALHASGVFQIGLVNEDV